jgi:hypothetical protein
MFFAALSAFLIAQTPANPIPAAQAPAAQTPASPSPAAAPTPSAPAFQAAMMVAEPVRLALTPNLDGKLDDEEWDPLVSTSDLKGFFQWEPGKLHFAGRVAKQNDILISIDFGSKGWLVGADHVEVRLTTSSGPPSFTIRRLDATQVSGPRWVELPGMTLASKVAATTDGYTTAFEFTLDDAGVGLCPMKDHGRVSVRMDAVPATMPPVEPYVPRLLAPLELEYIRSVALPTGMKFGVENAGVFVPAGEATRLRFTFNGNDGMKLQRLSLKGEGFAKNLAEIAVPFPAFDTKGRTFIDYNCAVPRGEGEGFRVVRGTLSGSDGLNGYMEASFRIAPVLDISLVRTEIHSKPQPQIVKLAYYIKSNSGRRIGGTSSVSATGTVTLAKPEQDKFLVDGPRSSVRMGFEVEIPAGTRGSFPLTFKVDAAGKQIESTGYVNIR